MMKEAIIYYSKTPHPSYNEYWDTKYHDVHFSHDDKPISLKRGFFTHYWRKLPIKEKVDSSKLRPEMERLFEKYNLYHSNPYSSENNGQHIIRDLGVHTSMSVEDIIKIGNTYYMVAPEGFRKIRFV